MNSWIRDPKRRNLLELSRNLNKKSKFEPKLKGMKQERSLNDIFYPRGTTSPVYFNLLGLVPNLTFELRPHYTQIPLKFAGLEDAY